MTLPLANMASTHPCDFRNRDRLNPMTSHLAAVTDRGDLSIRDALVQISNGTVGALVLVDPDGRLKGLVTDGDIRRALVRGMYIEESLALIVNTSPTTLLDTSSPAERFAVLRQKRLRHLLIVDSENRFVELLLSDDVARAPSATCPVVIMAGGEGRRLRPLTETCPKPMLRLNGVPILELILNRFTSFGFDEFYFAVNYLRDQIVDHFGDGKAFGARISYLMEDKPLGTAGALTLLPELEAENYLVTNGDLLTDMDFSLFSRYHTDQQAEATMAVRKIRHSLGFGLVKVDGTELVGIEEKPALSFYVNAGIYLLSAEAVQRIPQDTAYDMPDLFSKLRAEGAPCSVYEVHGNWIDIGTPDKLSEADELLSAQPES